MQVYISLLDFVTIADKICKYVSDSFQFRLAKIRIKVAEVDQLASAWTRIVNLFHQ